jgi:hypothetical protein
MARILLSLSLPHYQIAGEGASRGTAVEPSQAEGSGEGEMELLSRVPHGPSLAMFGRQLPVRFASHRGGTVCSTKGQRFST